MTGHDDAALEREARTFTRYLTGHPPTVAMVDRYSAAHRHAELHRLGIETPRDAFIVALARRHPMLTAVAEAWASRLRRRSVLRRKLVLVLALAECEPEHAARFDRPRSNGPILAALRGAMTVIAHVTLVALGLIFLSIPCLFLSDHREVPT